MSDSPEAGIYRDSRFLVSTYYTRSITTRPVRCRILDTLMIPVESLYQNVKHVKRIPVAAEKESRFERKSCEGRYV